MNQDWVNDWYRLGVTSDVAPGAVAKKRVGRMDLALFNVGGEFFACQDACGDCGRGLSDGVVTDSEVACADCGQSYRIAAGEQIGRRQRRLPTFPIMVVDDEIFACIENFAENLPP